MIHKMTLESNPLQPRVELGGRTYFDVTGGKYDLDAYAAAVGGTTVPGFQLRYLFFFDPATRARLTVPTLPFTEITRLGAGMYRGCPTRVRSVEPGTAAPAAGDGGNPIRTLQ